MKRKFATYNDGILHVCRKKEKETSFGAAKNVTQEEDLEKFLKLNFAEMSKRDEDMNFAESQGRSLNLKVKTRLHPDVSKTHMVIVADALYSIIHLDLDRSKHEMFFYLEEVRKIG